MLQRINTSKKLLTVACVFLFLFIFVLNCLTPYIADDFTYHYSFYDGTRIQAVSDIFLSMYGHAFKTNGRVIAHWFEQFFMLFPKVVFNLCNSCVYVALMYLLYRIANYHKQRNLLLFLIVCGMFWYYLPAFGEVALWQDGSVNYIWALLGGVLYLCPFFHHFLDPNGNRATPPDTYFARSYSARYPLSLAYTQRSHLLQ